MNIFSDLVALSSMCLKSPLWGRPLFFFLTLSSSVPQFLVELWSLLRLDMGQTGFNACFTSAAGADKSSRRGNTVGTSACGEHGWGRGCDVVSPSETVVISPLMGEIVWECDCVSGNCR